MKNEEVAIIGAGPAGLSAAIQLKRHGIDALVLERAAIGGVLQNANRVENYPGFPDGIAGPDLVRLFGSQAGRAGVAVTNDEVKKLDFDEDVFVIHGRDQTYRARAVVIASGTRPRTFTSLEIPKDVRERVFYEVYPLINESGMNIVIVGAGDAAFDYALNLADQNDVTILNRGTDTKCLPLLHDRAAANSNIEYVENTAIVGVEKSPSGGLRLACATPVGRTEIEADYLIGAIGRTENLNFISKKTHDRIAELREKGLLYLAGDVRRDRFRQTGIAVGDGILTAMTIHHRREEPSL